MLPGRIHAVVLVSRLHTPALRALAYARATRPDTLTALTVRPATRRPSRCTGLGRADIPVPLTVLDSPTATSPDRSLDHIGRHPPESPRDVIVVYIPEYVVGQWWEQVLHNQSALRLKARLLFIPGLMVTNVPWQLGSAQFAPGGAGRP